MDLHVNIAILECGHKYCEESINIVKRREKSSFYRCPKCKKEN